MKCPCLIHAKNLLITPFVKTFNKDRIEAAHHEKITKRSQFGHEHAVSEVDVPHA
jgi:hypothetical protein